jgi:hypothetical protein
MDLIVPYNLKMPRKDTKYTVLMTAKGETLIGEYPMKQFEVIRRGSPYV